jgi:(p)ppGpp synthase/HD superfamily hydrolase
MDKDLVKLAEEYCRYFHQEQRRVGGNQEPYEAHPFAVRDTLVKYGYDEPETQAIALLHDTLEDTKLGEDRDEIEKRFGTVVYEGVYVLSNNTSGKHCEELRPLFAQLGIDYVDENGILTPKAYKIRLLLSRDSIKRIKIADMIHNTRSLPDLSKGSIEKKLDDAETFYIPLGKFVAPVMVNELITNINNYKQSAHYRDNFGIRFLFGQEK